LHPTGRRSMHDQIMYDTPPVGLAGSTLEATAEIASTSRLRGGRKRRPRVRRRRGRRGFAGAVQVADLRGAAGGVTARNAAPALAIEPRRADRRAGDHAPIESGRAWRRRPRWAPQRQRRGHRGDVLLGGLGETVGRVTARGAGLRAKPGETVAGPGFDALDADQGEIDHRPPRCPWDDLDRAPDGPRRAMGAQPGDLRATGCRACEHKHPSDERARHPPFLPDAHGHVAAVRSIA